MPSTHAKTKSHSRMSAKEQEHIWKKHLTIRFNKKRDLVEIGWICDCRDPRCGAPHTTVAFYACTDPPCPPMR